MSLADLHALNDAVAHLDAALRGDDVTRIERAVADTRPIVERIAAAGAWHLNDDTRRLLKDIVGALDAARLRVSVLNDLGRRRLDMLAGRGVAVGPLTYGR